MPRHRDPARFGLRPIWIIGALAAALLALAGTFALSHRAALAELVQAQEAEMRSRIQTLDSILMRQRAVTTVLADDTLVLAALQDPTPGNLDRVSRKLEGLKDQTDSAVIYLLDAEGIGIAASNWREDTSFIGMDYGFRDYFNLAMQKGEATQFALGTVSNRAGLYLSHDVSGAPDGPALGVMVVKVEFDRLEQNWQRSHAGTDVLDGTGQVILSSDTTRRFRPAPPPARGEITTTAQIPGTDWTLAVTSQARPAFYAALLATGTAGFALTLLGTGAALILRERQRAARKAADERRYRADLEQAVDARTRALQGEIRERRALEVRLERLRAEMVQANKLAALGQITAGVAHEVNQPLATIRLLAENGTALLETDNRAELAGNLASITRMTNRIARITEELRGFARKADGQIGAVVLREALDVALHLTAPAREAQSIALDLPRISPDLRVRAETVALEQILVNLLQNAQEALAGRPEPRITITLAQGAPLQLTITDNGPGITPEIAAQLFTPFVTSKPRGMGLGLVISQDLARSFGGDLRLAPVQPARGASFILDLPRAE